MTSGRATHPLGILTRYQSTAKIDKSFVSHLTSADGKGSPAGVVRGIISLSHELGKKVVAEGTETAEQAKMLREYSYDSAQGYLFRKPVYQPALIASLQAMSLQESARTEEASPASKGV